MTKKTITQKDIFDAAQKLAASGDMPTIMLIRTELGDRGSETTINKHLQAWKKQMLESYINMQSDLQKGAAHTQILQDKIEHYQKIVEDLKKACIAMIKNPEHKIGVQEVIGILQ